MTKLISIFLFGGIAAHAQLTVSVSPLKITGSKVVVPLAMENNFTENVESARAAVFLLDPQGKMIAQGTQWVIGGGVQDRPSLAPGATNTFHFVITSSTPLTSTNLTANVSFTQLTLTGGKAADVRKNVQIQK